ncbi:MAG: hypothetical protein ACKVJE_09900, partial [Pseudomonadales bacterium]
TNFDIGDAESDLFKTKNVRKKSESIISLLKNKLFKKNTQKIPTVNISRNESDQKSSVPDSSDYRLLKSSLHTGRKPITIPEYVRKANEAFEKEYRRKGDKIFNGRDVSPLRYYGYIVGKNALPIKERREIIAITFNSDLPNIFPANYRLGWGEAGSSTRYNKILRHLRWLADQRRADRRYKDAVSHWDSDRIWLQAKLAKR